MKFHISLALGLSAVAAFAADPAAVKLEPNAIVHLEFPNLPPTYYAHSKGDKEPAQLNAELPSNYSADAKFPLFVFLQGGDGGPANEAMLKGVRAQIGERDFIAVTLPLFKNTDPAKASATDSVPKDMVENIPPGLLGLMNSYAAGVRITDLDYGVIAPSYATMLKALCDAVPNIDPTRSVIAGFSNGAHTVGMLLGREDPFILEHFHSFGMVEGGIPLVRTIPPELKNHRFLYLFGEGNAEEAKNDPMLAMLRPFAIGYIKDFVKSAAAADADVTLVMMTNTGHAFPPVYRELFRNWAQGGKIPSR